MNPDGAGDVSPERQLRAGSLFGMPVSCIVARARYRTDGSRGFATRGVKAMQQGGAAADVDRTARAAILAAPGEDVMVVDAVLDPPAPDEVIVRVAASGVCHTDLH